jgi:formate dehydrogenase subunit gamma
VSVSNESRGPTGSGPLAARPDEPGTIATGSIAADPVATSSVAASKDLVRFNVSQRIEHIVMLVAFTLLVLTGVPQKFLGSSLPQTMILAMGGIDMTRIIHRASAIVFILEALYHFGGIALSFARGRFTPSMIPGRKDFEDSLTYFRYCLGLENRRPLFDRFDYKQKWEYWGVVLGGFLMIGTGLVLMYPALLSRFLPGSIVPAARELHGGEALLAFLIIVTWHLYSAHINPDRFPGDNSIFTGKISRERMIEEHPIEYSRLTGVPVEELVEHEHGHGDGRGDGHGAAAPAESASPGSPAG